VIRLATAEDSAAMATVHVRSWQSAFRGSIPDAYLDALDVEKQAASWHRILSQVRVEIAVYELEGQVVGFLCLGLSRDAGAAAGTGEVMALHVDPALWRGGLGRQLMDWAKDVARARGWKLVTLWVLRENVRARRFYEAIGFRTDGVTHERNFDGVAIPDVRYAWPCSG
jgi:GNAT superfamily N-acetyltransferase